MRLEEISLERLLKREGNLALLERRFGYRLGMRYARWIRLFELKAPQSILDNEGLLVVEALKDYNRIYKLLNKVMDEAIRREDEAR